MIKTILDNKYLIKPVTILNHSEIKKLYNSCSDYHIMSSGKNATDDDVDNIFKYNDKKTAENSLTLGVYNKFELLIGMVDIFKNYPENDTWMIGLLLLSPEERNKNLGKIIHEEVKNYALSQGANTLRIGVIEENIKGKRFWDSLGYKKIKSTTIDMGDKKHNLDILILSIK